MSEEKHQFIIKSRGDLIAARRGKVGIGMDPSVRGNPTQTEKLLRVCEMGFHDSLLEKVRPQVQNLTVSDLEDFAKRMAGIEVTNPRVNELTIEDVQGIELLFADAKGQALASVASRLGDGVGLGGLAASVDVSCCCCTPCCCCAATETDPFATA